MYILKLKMGKYDHTHLTVVISKSIDKLESIKNEWNEIESIALNIGKNDPIDSLIKLANDFFTKYEVMAPFETFNGEYITMENFIKEEVESIICSYIYITTVKQL